MINPEKVNEIFLACLFNDDEIGEDGKPKNGVEPIIAEGIISKIGFHPDRLKKHEQEIIEMLRQLPHQFRKTEGGGWTFLNACNIEEGDQWTGLHQRMEQLFQLGIAIKKACWLLPREMWGSLPGSMPYVQIDI